MLQADPSVVLNPPPVEPLKSGPVHFAQYVIELVGPRSVPAQSAAQLLSPNWYAALGSPQIFAMRPSDTIWHALSPQRDGSYDSIALCWDILSDQGVLSKQSGEHLLQTSEQFANALQRRALPLPIPNDLSRTARALQEAQSQLDIGISLIVIPGQGTVTERDLWIQCARMGLKYSPGGSFDWTNPLHPSPLFSVTPIGSVDTFSLGAAQTETRHDGVTIGFSVPKNPAPIAALEGAFQAADVIARAIPGAAFDEDARPLTDSVRNEIRRSLQEATAMLEQSGIRPGSPAAIKLFGT